MKAAIITRAKRRSENVTAHHGANAIALTDIALYTLMIQLPSSTLKPIAPRMSASATLVMFSLKPDTSTTSSTPHRPTTMRRSKAGADGAAGAWGKATALIGAGRSVQRTAGEATWRALGDGGERSLGRPTAAKNGVGAMPPVRGTHVSGPMPGGCRAWARHYRMRVGADRWSAQDSGRCRPLVGTPSGSTRRQRRTSP